MDIDLGIKKGSEIGNDEFPLFLETLEYFDLIMDVDDFGITYFQDQLNLDADYAVIRTEDFKELAPSSRRQLQKTIAARGLDGTQTAEELAAFVKSMTLNTVDRVVSDLAELHRRGLSTEEKEEIDALVAEVEADYSSGAAQDLEPLLTNLNVGRILQSDSSFLETTPADEETLARIRDTSMPAYFVIDVSVSMEDEHRIDYANEFAQRVGEHLKAERITDDLKCLIFWGENRFIDLNDPRRFRTNYSTGTGSALSVVADDIREQNYGRPVFLALVTDGLPNCEGMYQGVLLDPVECTVKMASLLPDNVIFSQIAFAPLESGDPNHPATLEEFELYLTDLKRVTDAVKHGQTYVMVKDSEQHLPWLSLGAYQKAKHFTLLGDDFAAVDDI